MEKEAPPLKDQSILYKEFCQVHSLKQLIICPTRVTCNISTLIDHILTSSTEKIF